MELFKSILTVSELNHQIKSFLEYEIGLVQVKGELSNLSKPSSGHLYFTLKDQSAQIRCVYFKNRNSANKTQSLAEGQQFIASGRLSLYEARGDYQLIVDNLLEAGLGLLYQQYETLKNRLAAEGLFNQENKKKLPLFPKAIGIISSSSGAALQDILSTLLKRFRLAPIYIYPCEVQGASSAQQLMSAIKLANKEACCDVLILARGGGSIEDLWSFNNEHLARVIAASIIPIISGVGHETDFTITDFVADYRAETPTAAAIAATPNTDELIRSLQLFHQRLTESVRRKLYLQQIQLNHILKRVASPNKVIASHWQTVDYLERQLIIHCLHLVKNKRHQLQFDIQQLQMQNPKLKLNEAHSRLKEVHIQLLHTFKNSFHHLKLNFSHLIATLNAVSPLATLERGYAIASIENQIIFSSAQVLQGDSIKVLLSKGSLQCHVEACDPN